MKTLAALATKFPTERLSTLSMMQNNGNQPKGVGLRYEYPSGRDYENRKSSLTPPRRRGCESVCCLRGRGTLVETYVEKGNVEAYDVAGYAAEDKARIN